MDERVWMKGARPGGLSKHLATTLEENGKIIRGERRRGGKRKMPRPLCSTDTTRPPLSLLPKIQQLANFSSSHSTDENPPAIPTSRYTTIRNFTIESQALMSLSERHILKKKETDTEQADRQSYSGREDQIEERVRIDCFMDCGFSGMKILRC